MSDSTTATGAAALAPQPTNDLPVYPALSTTSDKPPVPPSPAAAPVAPEADPPAPASERTDEPAGEPDTDKPADEAEPRPRRGRPSSDSRLTAIETQLGQLAEVLGKLVPQQQAPAAAPKEPEPAPRLVRPRRSDYDDPDAFEDALIEYATEAAAQKATEASARQRRQETEAEAAAKQQQAAEEANRQMAEAWTARVNEARARYDDYDDVAFDTATPITPAMLHAIINSDYGADIAYWLGSHQKDAKRIAEIPNVVKQALEIGRIETAFVKAAAEDAAPEPAPRRAAQSAARPIRPLQPRSAPVEEAPSEQNSQSRIEAMLNDLRSGNQALGWGPGGGRA